VFGINFSFTGGTIYTNVNADGTTTQGWNDNYSDSNSGGLTLSYSSASGYSVSGWDPSIGSFSGSSSSGVNASSVTWDPRSAPSFTTATQYYLSGPNNNATLISWAIGSLDSYGNVTDTYRSPDGSTVMTVSGTLSDGHGSVVINSSAAGSLTAGSYTPGGGYTLEAKDTNLTTALFAESNVLYVNNTEYDFVGAYDDNQGNRVDIYTNVSVGTIALAGTTNNNGSAYVTVSYYGGSYLGSYSWGSFSVNGLTIGTTVTPPTPPTCNTTTTPPTCNTTTAPPTCNTTTAPPTCNTTTAPPTCNTTTTPPTCNTTTTPPTCNTTTTPPVVPVYGPDAFWLAGQFYARTSDTSQNQFKAPDNSTVTLTGEDNGPLSFTAKTPNGTTVYTGSYNQSSNGSGLFTVTQSSTNALVPVWPASNLEPVINFCRIETRA
jgi:hypothetical protein